MSRKTGLIWQNSALVTPSALETCLGFAIDYNAFKLRRVLHPIQCKILGLTTRALLL